MLLFCSKTDFLWLTVIFPKFPILRTEYIMNGQHLLILIQNYSSVENEELKKYREVHHKQLFRKPHLYHIFD